MYGVLNSNYSKILSKNAKTDQIDTNGTNFVSSERYNFMTTETKKPKFETKRRDYNKYLITELEMAATGKKSENQSEYLSHIWDDNFEQDRKNKELMANDDLKNVVKLINYSKN